MSTSDDIRADLVAYLHGELDEERAAHVSERVAGDPELAAELASLRVVARLAYDGSIVEPAVEETAELLDVLDGALEESQPHAPVLRMWDTAVRRYRRSARFRRVTIASIGVHAAAAAAVAWVLVGPGGPLSPTVRIANDPASGWEQIALQDPLADLEDADISRPDEEVSQAVQETPFETVDLDEGYRLPDVMETPAMRARGDRLRFPTRAIMAHISIRIDPEQRAERMRVALDDLAPRAGAAVQSGLAWLAERRGADGRWGAVPAEGAEDFRDGVTAACVLSFVQSGHSAVEGEYAEVLAPAVAALARRLRDGPSAGDVKPVYSHALAIRALTWQWAADFGRLTREERRERLDVLSAAGEALLDWQNEDGGFGYRSDVLRADSSCTLFATAALADLRLAGVLRSDAALERAGRFVAAQRGRSGGLGYEEPADRLDDLALTAGMLAYAPELAISDSLGPALRAVERRLTARSGHDALLGWSGLRALRRHRRPLVAATRKVLDGQRQDGSWPSGTDRHCRLGGDELTTALGVLSVTRVYLP